MRLARLKRQWVLVQAARCHQADGTASFGIGDANLDGVEAVLRDEIVRVLLAPTLERSRWLGLRATPRRRFEVSY